MLCAIFSCNSSSRNTVTGVASSAAALGKGAVMTTASSFWTLSLAWAKGVAIIGKAKISNRFMAIYTPR